MTPSHPLRPAALLLLVLLAGPAAAAEAPAAPAALRCTVDWGSLSPLVQTYRLDRAAGRVTADEGILFSATGATQRDERSTIVRTIETWTDAELVLREEMKSTVRSTTIRQFIDLRTLAIRTTAASTMPNLKLTPHEYKGTCQAVDGAAAPAKG
jgi:hypothetical protein